MLAEEGQMHLGVLPMLHLGRFFGPSVGPQHRLLRLLLARPEMASVVADDPRVVSDDPEAMSGLEKLLLGLE